MAVITRSFRVIWVGVAMGGQCRGRTYLLWSDARQLHLREGDVGTSQSPETQDFFLSSFFLLGTSDSNLISPGCLSVVLFPHFPLLWAECLMLTTSGSLEEVSAS